MQAKIKAILQEYNQHRTYEESRVNELIKKLMYENPEFKKARKEYSSARANHAISKLKGKTTDINSVKKQYREKLKSACKKSGIDEGDLEIRYTCTDCKDTGYIGQNEKLPCHCLINKITKSIMVSQNLMKNATFDNFDELIFPNDKKVDKQGRTQREHILYVKERAVKWCEAFPHTNKIQTLFLGATGVGKSFLVNCIAHEIIKKGYSVVNSTASGINEAMLKIIKGKDTSLLVLFKSCDLLIIDDLGVEPMINNVTIETLYEILEYRILNQNHTIICTNLSIASIEDKYGYRTSSRISSSKNTALMYIYGEDLRRL